MRITMNFCFYIISSRNVGIPPLLFVTTLLILLSANATFHSAKGRKKFHSQPT